MSDSLFPLPFDGPDRLTRARNRLAQAEADLEKAEAAHDELGLSTRHARDAVASARYELQSAELERLRDR
jgi:multidrug resistance efflux pump